MISNVSGATRKFTSLFNFYATVSPPLHQVCFFLLLIPLLVSISQVLKQESIAALFRGSTLLAIRSAVFSFFRFSLEYFIDR